MTVFGRLLVKLDRATDKSVPSITHHFSEQMFDGKQARRRHAEQPPSRSPRAASPLFPRHPHPPTSHVPTHLGPCHHCSRGTHTLRPATCPLTLGHVTTVPEAPRNRHTAPARRRAAPPRPPRLGRRYDRRATIKRGRPASMLPWRGRTGRRRVRGIRSGAPDQPTQAATVMGSDTAAATDPDRAVSGSVIVTSTLAAPPVTGYCCSASSRIRSR